MSLALYAIGATIAIIVLAARLHETREELRYLRQQRNAYIPVVQAVESWLRSSEGFCDDRPAREDNLRRIRRLDD